MKMVVEAVPNLVRRHALNKFLTRWGGEPWQVARTTILALAAVYAVTKLSGRVRRHGLKKTVLFLLLKVARTVPQLRRRLQQEQRKFGGDMREEIFAMLPRRGEWKNMHELPECGMSADDLMTQLRQWRDLEDPLWRSGQNSGAVYHGQSELQRFLGDVFGMFSLSNPLHPDLFPFVRKMDAEVVRMTVSLFNGDDDACGTTTTGGTESILMAMKAYRDWGRQVKGIPADVQPRVIAPRSAHAAFEKAAHYFGIDLVLVDVLPDSYRVDVAQVARHIDWRTVALVGSAPNFPQGIMDDIEALSALAVKHAIGLHVDCCLGGFLMPFLERLAQETGQSHWRPRGRFDFRVEGVTSISADTHKYGYAVKGSSVIMYRDASWRRHQYFVTPEWMGGIYATPTITGSRAGGLLASTWAAMMRMGTRGYLDCAKAIMEARDIVMRGVRDAPGVHVMGQPDMSVVAVRSDNEDELNIYKVADAMKRRGWHLNSLQNPACFHLCVTYANASKAPRFVQHLLESVDEVRVNPESFEGGSAAIYGMASQVPDTSMVGDLAAAFIDGLYATDKSD